MVGSSVCWTVESLPQKSSPSSTCPSVMRLRRMAPSSCSAARYPPRAGGSDSSNSDSNTLILHSSASGAQVSVFFFFLRFGGAPAMSMPPLLPSSAAPVPTPPAALGTADAGITTRETAPRNGVNPSGGDMAPAAPCPFAADGDAPPPGRDFAAGSPDGASGERARFTATAFADAVLSPAPSVRERFASGAWEAASRCRRASDGPLARPRREDAPTGLLGAAVVAGLEGLAAGAAAAAAAAVGDVALDTAAPAPPTADLAALSEPLCFDFLFFFPLDLSDPFLRSASAIQCLHSMSASSISRTASGYVGARGTPSTTLPSVCTRDSLPTWPAMLAAATCSIVAGSRSKTCNVCSNTTTLSASPSPCGPPSLIHFFSAPIPFSSANRWRTSRRVDNSTCSSRSRCCSCRSADNLRTKLRTASCFPMPPCWSTNCSRSRSKGVGATLGRSLAAMAGAPTASPFTSTPASGCTPVNLAWCAARTYRLCVCVANLRATSWSESRSRSASCRVAPRSATTAPLIAATSGTSEPEPRRAVNNVN
mmetsp:Transcript_14462/g.50316  ORF Transcript_14462/g.50316 Transcript_14462/m.50316 type:complete len:538 (-) Transcript_14462:249-1862(-)